VSLMVVASLAYGRALLTQFYALLIGVGIMKITKSQLKQLIREAVREHLREGTTSSESQVAFDRLNDLKDRYELDFWILDKGGADILQQVYDLRDASKDYSDFYHKVGPGKYNSTKGSHDRTNRIGLSAERVKTLWSNRSASTSVQELQKLKQEFDQLKGRFISQKASSKADSVYGRKRTNMVDTQTGEVVSSKTDREGSLGS